MVERGFTGDLSIIVQEVEREILQRKRGGSESLIRKQYIEKYYQPLHKDLYELKESYLSSTFLELVDYCKTKEANKEDLVKKIRICKGEQIYSIPVFKKVICKQIIEECKHFERSEMPKGRPNTMNQTGLLLEEMGFYPKFINPLRTNYLEPVVSILYPQWVGNHVGLDSQRAFIVTYKTNGGKESEDLSLHFDNSEVTLNISLSDGFEGGELYFCGMWKEHPKDPQPVDHKQSYGVVHRGRHLHGAMPLESGERYNLIMWMRSSDIRNQECPMCEQPPLLVETEGEDGGFTQGAMVQVCNVF